MICRNETTENYLAAHRNILEMLRQPNETPDTQLPEDYSQEYARILPYIRIRLQTLSSLYDALQARLNVLVLWT